MADADNRGTEMGINQKARRVRRLTDLISANMRKTAKYQDELCGLLCDGAEEFAPELGLSDDTVQAVIAPKDDA